MHPRKFCLTLILATVFAAAVQMEALAQASGEVAAAKCWAYPSAASPASIMAADTAGVYLGMKGARVESLSLSGGKIWSSELGGEISSDILPLNGEIFVVTTATSADAAVKPAGVLRSLSRDTGVTNWTKSLNGAERHFLTTYNGRVLAVSSDGSVHSVDAATGNVAWRREIAAGFAGRPVFGRSRIIVATTGNQVFAINAATGEIESMKKLPYAVTALAETAAGEIIAGDERGNIYSAVNGPEKLGWKFKTGGEISAILDSGTHLIAASHDNFVYFLLGRNGHVGWKRRLAGRASHAVNLSEGFALIAGVEDNGAAFIDLDNGKVAGQIVFSEDEKLSAPPVISGKLILTATLKGVYAYSLGGCPQMDEGGRADLLTTAPVK